MRLALITLMLLAPTPGLAATFITGGVGTAADTFLGGVSNLQTSSATATGPTSSASTNSVSTVTNSGGTGTAQSAASAAWTSANAGTATMSWGWNGQTTGSTQFSTNGAPQNWFYTFQTGATASQFIANWVFSVTGTGSSLGLQGVYGTGSSPFNVTPFTLAPTGTSNGSFTVNLASNTLYTFGFRNFGNIGSGSGGGSFDTKGDFALDWRIAGAGAVPEPATWAMLILGFGLVGGALRQRTAASVRVRFQPA